MTYKNLDSINYEKDTNKHKLSKDEYISNYLGDKSINLEYDTAEIKLSKLTLICGSLDDTITIFNTKKFTKTDIIKTECEGVYSLLMINKGFLSGGGNGFIKRWSTKGELIYHIKAHNGNVNLMIKSKNCQFNW